MLTNAPVDLGLIKLPTDSLMFPSAWHGAIDLARPRDCRALSDMFTAKAKALGFPTRLHDLRVTHETMPLAILHTRRHRWRATPLDPLPWQMSVAPAFLWMLALVAEPGGHFDFDKWQLWAALLYIGAFAGPAGTWAAVSVSRALSPITSSLGMPGVPLVGIVSSVILVGEPITAPLLLGTALVSAGIAVVILDRG